MCTQSPCCLVCARMAGAVGHPLASEEDAIPHRRMPGGDQYDASWCLPSVSRIWSGRSVYTRSRQVPAPAPCTYAMLNLTLAVLRWCCREAAQPVAVHATAYNYNHQSGTLHLPFDNPGSSPVALTEIAAAGRTYPALTQVSGTPGHVTCSLCLVLRLSGATTHTHSMSCCRWRRLGQSWPACWPKVLPCKP